MTLRCVNCSLRIAQIRRHRLSEENEETVERVRRWVYPRDISGADCICHACWELLTQNSEELQPPRRGHDNVCAACGRAILRIRSRPVLRPEMSERETHVGNIVQQNNLNMRHSMFHNITRTNLEFPEMSIEDLQLIALGTYHIRQAKSYVGEHLRAHGMYSIQVSRSEVNTRILFAFNGIDPYVLRAKIKSRHVGCRSYFTYVVVDRALQGRHAILGYYCHCAAGKRTVGCCSHTMSVLWYMGFARHQEYIEAPAAFLDDLLIM